jgi:hypothetical protein
VREAAKEGKNFFARRVEKSLDFCHSRVLRETTIDVIKAVTIAQGRFNICGDTRSPLRLVVFYGALKLEKEERKKTMIMMMELSYRQKSD